MPAPFRWWLRKWLTKPADLFSGWVAFGWAVSLLRDPDPVYGPHVHMASLLPLWVYGAVALCVFASYWFANTLAPLVGYRWKRHHAHSFACAFWTFVFVLFATSGTSITGFVVYGFLAIMTGMHALGVPRDHD